MRRRLAALVAACAVLVPFAGTASADPVLSEGIVTARFTGQPVPGACVTAFDANQVQVAQDCADAAGHYSVSVPTGSWGPFKLRTTAEGYAETWYARHSGVDARDFASADPVYTGDPRHELGLRPPGVGVLRGTLTTSAGAPIEYASVQVVDVDGGHWGPSTSTAADGTYRFTGLWPGHYKIQFRSPHDGEQWYPRQEANSGAEAVVVAGDVETVVDERTLPPGTVDLTVVDEVSGAPVRDFCVFTPGVGADRPCTTDGRVSYPLNRGTYTLHVTPGRTHFGVDHRDVVVRSGETTRVVARVKPGVAIRTTVRDARTGAPVAGTCVQPVAVAGHGVSGEFASDWCSDASGAVTLGPLAPAAYRLLARPAEPHGLQWVGWLGGTGDQRRARVLDATPGRWTDLPPIRLDRAGTVTGVVRDGATGAGVEGACVFAYATTSAYGDACTDGNGAYRLTGLGPYRWPLEFAHAPGEYAWQWSGGAADRFGAAPVAVRAGREVAHDESLVPAGSVSGATSVDGDEFGWVEVTPVNARTGDVAGVATTNYGFGYIVPGLNTQEVKLHFRVVERDPRREVWYRDAASFDAATPVAVTAGADVPGTDQHIG
ncbi:MSCRAMM family protein [Saccharothrix sp. Mg75]|uniref:MSCRAMM family protein n=1 Tax=Saccharothrix sp. Mg75 TaxID=3445357 RepID=UPI003EEE7108